MVESFQRTEELRLQRCRMSSREELNGDLLSGDLSRCVAATFDDGKQSKSTHRRQFMLRRERLRVL